MLGVVALMYAAFGVLISKCRDTEDDGINTVSAATLTGLLFKVVCSFLLFFSLIREVHDFTIFY